MTLKRLIQFALMVSLAAPVMAASAADLKLGYVDAIRLLEEAPQAQEATRRLQREFASREEEMVRKQDEIRRMEDALERDGAVMTESDRRNRGLEVLALKRELRRMQEEFREDVNIRRNDALGGLQELIKETIQEVGSAGDFDLIFFEGIAYADEALDITAQVLEGLARRHQSRSGDR
jgi:outer membrane protein